jgi:ribosomal protein S18 acetylase RimI-like enzyme
MDIYFKKATADDIPLISTLAGTIWRSHYPDIISPGQIDYMLDMMYAEQSIAKQMAENQNYTLIYADSKAVGYYAISEKTPAHFFLHKFYIDTQRHRTGIGSAAFDHMVQYNCKGYKEISLQVNRRNVKAINFYFKKGFTIDHSFDFDIGGGYFMDDFLMKLKSLA